MQQLRLGRSILIQLLVVIVVVIALGSYFSDTLRMIYFSNQQTSAGFALNGLIVVLFLLGMIRVVMLLFGYDREEKALQRFQYNLDSGPDLLLDDVDPASIIAVRIGMMESMRLKHAPIHHQAMAATLLATESTRTGLIRFIHNILILCGVLGTIISLSIALFGASNMLDNAVSSGGMGMVIHGMSTALSTTMSAILCYLVLAYFLAAIQNLQTRLLASVEEFTAMHLLPMYQVSEESISQHAVDLVREAHAVMQTINEQLSHLNLASLTEEIQHSRLQSERIHEENKAQMQQHHDDAKAQLADLSSTIKDGFRLPGA